MKFVKNVNQSRPLNGSELKIVKIFNVPAAILNLDVIRIINGEEY